MNSDILPYVLQPMRVQDIPEVLEIERVCFSMPWSAHAYRYEIEENTLSWYVVARPTHRRAERRLLGKILNLRSAGQPRTPIIGYGGFWMMVDEAHISTLAVAPPYRRRGVGELLLLTMIEEAERRGAAAVTLEVRVSNLPAQRLYEKYGFTVQGRRVRYYSDNGEDAYIMTTPPLRSASYREMLEALKARLYARLASEKQTGAS
ncbi:MAG: ribosomal protein S18-alanine N-acetyltransferase [Anaerolineae bacterium]|nr:ribosomal protein S18-alanine N-acetyltransferase [Anaerolineae bacterium]